MKTNLKNYYVYHLIDPRDNQVFYVGKGIHSRVNAHEQQANDMLNDILDNDVTAPKKIQMINDIISSGYQIEKEIFPNMTEQEAFDNESKDIYVFRKRYPNKMTNIQSGHHCDWLKTTEEVEDIQIANSKDDRIFKKYISNGKKILAIINNRSWNYNDSYNQRYDKFRSGWKLNVNKAKNVDMILIIHNNIIKYVYNNIKFTKHDKRCDFIGTNINNELVNTYCDIKFSRLGFKYFNI